MVQCLVMVVVEQKMKLTSQQLTINFNTLFKILSITAETGPNRRAKGKPYHSLLTVLSSSFV